MSKSFIFFVVIISCRALKETNNVAWFFVGFFFFCLSSPRDLFFRILFVIVLQELKKD